MRSNRASIIFGGLVLGSLLALVVARTIQAVPLQPHAFNGEVRVGDVPKAGLEIKVEVFDEELNKLVPLDFTAGSVNVTATDGTFGQQAPFAVRGDITDTQEREGGVSGERHVFFLVTPDGTGDAATKAAVEIESTNKVDIVLKPRTPEFIRNLPFLVDILVNPNGAPVDQVHAFLDFNTGDLEMVSIAPGFELADVLQSSGDNTDGTVDYRAKTGQIDLPLTSEFVLATVTFKPMTPIGKSDVQFHRESPRETEAVLAGAPVLRSLAGLELVRSVQAATSITPVLFVEAGNTPKFGLSILGPPGNVEIQPGSPSSDPRPSLYLGSPHW